VLRILREQAPRLRARDHAFEPVRLNGPGEAGPESDIDLLIEPNPPPSLDCSICSIFARSWGSGSIDRSVSRSARRMRPWLSHPIGPRAPPG
jgi:hypothetical protein